MMLLLTMSFAQLLGLAISLRHCHSDVVVPGFRACPNYGRVTRKTSLYAEVCSDSLL
jgi:hypothetical protein